MSQRFRKRRAGCTLDADMRTIRRLLAACALAITAWALLACDGGRSEVVLRTDDPKLLATGEKIYQAQCAACHGARLEGQPNWRQRDASGRMPAPPHDASGHTWHHPDQLLFDITKHGVAAASKLKDYDSAMPAFDGVLSDAEILAALSWIKSQWPAEIRMHQEEIDAASKRRR
jgi:mono/diheme cytochrome c family protein